MSPDSTSFVSSIIHNPQALLELIAVILAVIAFFPKIYRWLRNYSDRRSLKKRSGAELYTQQDILLATKFYLKPNCQDVDPSQEEEIRAVHAVTNKLFEKVDELMDKADKFRYLIMLADSGMGKTAFVLNYYFRHWRSYFRRRKFKIALVPLGIKDADSHIKKIYEQSNTVLFLDAFDEDTRAIQNHRLRLANLLGLCSSFRQVLVTSRTQFFEKEEEVPRETGIVRVGITGLGEDREYVFYKLYLSPFSDDQVKKYLKRRFHFWQRNKCRRAREIVAQIPQLTVRPMLLAHIPDLVKTKKQFKYSFQLYEAMIDKWLYRERPFVKNKDELRKFSEQLAIDLYVKRKDRGSERVHYSYLEPIARSFGINLKDWQLRGRSLLNRDVAGNYKFAHRSIMEYLFVKRFLVLPSQSRFQIKWTDQMYQFLSEEVRFHWETNNKFPDLTKIDLRGLISLKLKPLIVLRNSIKKMASNDVEAMIKKFDFCDQNRNKKGKGVPHVYLKLEKEMVVVDYTTGLMWQQCGSFDTMIIKKVKDWIADLNRKRYAGYNDWRLPTLEETMCLMETKKMNVDLYIDPKFDRTQRWIWTSDPYPGAAAQWVVSFYSGYCDYRLLDYDGYVRAVRFGQLSP